MTSCGPISLVSVVAGPAICGPGSKQYLTVWFRVATEGGIVHVCS